VALVQPVAAGNRSWRSPNVGRAESSDKRGRAKGTRRRGRTRTVPWSTGLWCWRGSLSGPTGQGIRATGIVASGPFSVERAGE
jgi:hypothetical protein